MSMIVFRSAGLCFRLSNNALLFPVIATRVQMSLCLCSLSVFGCTPLEFPQEFAIARRRSSLRSRHAGFSRG